MIVPPIRTGGESCIEIGDGVYVGSDSWIQVIGSPDLPKAVAIRIGDRTSISGHVTITSIKSVTIEQAVLIARYVYISDHSHVFDSRVTPIKDQGLTNARPVRICEGAWIGQGAVICPGVTIGRNAVVGANSVVRQNVPDFCVAAGAPAKTIRTIGESVSAPVTG